MYRSDGYDIVGVVIINHSITMPQYLLYFGRFHPRIHAPGLKLSGDLVPRTIKKANISLSRPAYIVSQYT